MAVFGFRTLPNPNNSMFLQVNSDNSLSGWNSSRHFGFGVIPSLNIPPLFCFLGCFFFPSGPLSAGSAPWSGSRSGHTNFCVRGGQEWDERGRNAKIWLCRNTKIITTASLTYPGGFSMNDWRAGGLKGTQKSWIQDDSAYNQGTIYTNMHSGSLCFHWNNAVQKWWIFPYLGCLPETKEKLAGTEGNTQENISWIDWLFTRIHYVAVEITKGFFFKGKKYKDEVKI